MGTLCSGLAPRKAEEPAQVSVRTRRRGWILPMAAGRQAAGNLQAKPGPVCRRLPAGSTPGCLTSPESSEYRDLLTLRPFEMKIWEAGSAGGRQACESFPGNRAEAPGWRRKPGRGGGRKGAEGVAAPSGCLPAQRPRKDLRWLQGHALGPGTPGPAAGLGKGRRTLLTGERVWDTQGALRRGMGHGKGVGAHWEGPD